MNFLNKVNFDFGFVYFYDDYLCLEVNDYINFNTNEFDKLLENKINFYGDRKIGYMSHRINSFSFDPLIFINRKLLIKQHFKWLIIISNREFDKIENNYLNKLCPIPCKYLKKKEVSFFHTKD